MDGWGNRDPEWREPRVRTASLGAWLVRGTDQGGLPTPFPQFRRSVQWAGLGGRVPAFPIACPTPPHLSLCKPRRGVCPSTLPSRLGLSSAGCRGRTHLSGGSGRPAGEVSWLPTGLQLRVPGEVSQNSAVHRTAGFPASGPASSPRRPDPHPQSFRRQWGLAPRLGSGGGPPAKVGAQGVPARRLAGRGRGWAVTEAPGPCAHPLAASLLAGWGRQWRPWQWPCPFPEPRHTVLGATSEGFIQPP